MHVCTLIPNPLTELLVRSPTPATSRRAADDPHMWVVHPRTMCMAPLRGSSSSHVCAQTCMDAWMHGRGLLPLPWYIDDIHDGIHYGMISMMVFIMVWYPWWYSLWYSLYFLKSAHWYSSIHYDWSLHIGINGFYLPESKLKFISSDRCLIIDLCTSEWSSVLMTSCPVR